MRRPLSRVATLLGIAFALGLSGGCGRHGEVESPAGTGAGSGRIPAVTQATFEREVLQSPIPVAVDFWAPWCGPCRAVAPILDKMSVEFEGRLKICKVNVDDNKALASQYGIRGIPTILVFKSGRTTATKVGSADEAEYRNWFTSQLR